MEGAGGGGECVIAHHVPFLTRGIFARQLRNLLAGVLLSSVEIHRCMLEAAFKVSLFADRVE
jgi:hypothetical protein